MKILRIFFLFLIGQMLWPAASLRAASPKDPDRDYRKIIKEIRIAGVKNFKERAVREFVRTRPKHFYSEKALEEDVREILGSGNFESADFSVLEVPGGIRVTYTVKERPWVKKVDFTGNKKLSNSKLKEEMSLKTKEGFDKIKLDKDVQTILSLYGEKGYADCKVEPFTSFNDAENRVTVNFVIKEGHRVLIEKVEFEGAQAFTAKKLRRVFKETRRKKVYNSEKFKTDLKLLEMFYKNNGYAKVELGEARFTYNEPRTHMTLTLPITEGQLYVVGTFEFFGQSLYPVKDLLKSVEMKTNAIYSQEKYDQTLQNLQELYLEKGHLNARIEPEELPEKSAKRINYRFRINEGSVSYIDRIFIEGNKKTREKVFRREVQLKPGDPFSSSKVRRSQEKIFNLGFIDDVKPDLQPGREPGKVDLIMDIVEGKPGSLSAGAGFSSNDGLVGQIQLSHANLFGLAQRMSLMWEFGSRKQNYELNWTEPWILDKPISLGFDVYNTIRERLFDSDSSPDYTENRSGAGIRVGPRFSDIWSLLFNYAFTKIQVSRVREQFKNQIKEENQITSSFGTELARDTRDYYFDAARGSRNSISVNLTGGPFQGNVHFVKSIFSSSWYWTTFKIGHYPYVFSVNARAGGVQEYAPSETVPIFERFFVGGADSVRGYQSRGEIGPMDGGRAFTVMNAEYKVPLYVENKRRILQLVFFADIGGAWRSGKDIGIKVGQSGNAFDNERYLKSAVGFGLRITTPVFPIRLDWGYGLNHRPGEDLSQIHFTLGNLF